MIIFLYGPDTFRSKRKLKELKEKFIKEVDKSGLNLEILDGENLEAQDFEKAIATLPFLAKKRMIIIENLIAKNTGQKIQKEIIEFLDKNNLKDNIIIFWEGDIETGRKNHRSQLSIKRSYSLFERLKKEEYAQNFKLFNLTKVVSWTSREIKKRHGEIKIVALNTLIDLIGNDLWQMNSEIDKLIAYCHNREITNQDIKKIVSPKIDDNIFKLTDAIAQKNKSLAIKLINENMLSGTKETIILAKIIWQFKNLILIKDLIESKKIQPSLEIISQTLRLHPFVVKKALATARNYNLNQLKKIYYRLLTIDYKIKTSQVEPRVLFDLLVIAG